MSQIDIEKLKNIPIFVPIRDDAEAMEKVSQIMKVVRFRKGKELMREGDPGDEMFILAEGRVRILKKTLEQQPYTVVILSEENNVFLGELAMMDNDTRSATVVAETECVAYRITKKGFDDLGNREPRIGLVVTREIAKLLASRIRRANDDTVLLFAALVNEIESGES